MKKIILLVLFFNAPITFSQTKVSGIILDDAKQPVSYATVAFKNSAEGVIADENGKFYIESKKTYPTLVVSFVGYKDTEVALSGTFNYDLKIVLENANEIAEVKIATDAYNVTIKAVADAKGLAFVWSRDFHPR